MAGNTAYNGVLVALEGLFGIKRRQGKVWIGIRKNWARLIKRYLQALIVRTICFILMGYDGELNLDAALVGLKEAETIINKVESWRLGYLTVFNV